MIHVLYPEEISRKASSIAGDPDLEPTPPIEASLEHPLPPSEALPESPQSLDETIAQDSTLKADPLTAGSASPDSDGSAPPLDTSLEPSELEPSESDRANGSAIAQANPKNDDASIPPEAPLPDPYELHTAGPLTYFQYYIDDDTASEASVDYAPQVFSTSKLPTGLIGAGVLAVTVVSGFMIAESTKQPTLRPSAALQPSQNAQPQASLPSSPAKPPISQPETIVAAKPLSVPRTPTFPAVPNPLPAPPPITPLSAAPKLQIHPGIKLTPMAIAQPETLSATSTALVAQAQSAPNPSLPEPLPSVTIPRDEPIPSLTTPPSPSLGANDFQPSEAMVNPALNPSTAVSTPQPGITTSPIAPPTAPQSDLSTAAVAPLDTSSSIAPSLSPPSNPSPTQSIAASSPATIGRDPQPMPAPDSTAASTQPLSPLATARDSTPTGSSTAPTNVTQSIANSTPSLIANSASAVTTAANPSQILNSLRNLQDYLNVPQKLANLKAIDLLPLNLTAATEASTRPTGLEIDHYTIVRMNYNDYAQAWRTSSNPSSNSDSNPNSSSESRSSSNSLDNSGGISGFPPHGFIDYKHQRIVLPQDTANATSPFTSPSTQLSQNLPDR